MIAVDIICQKYDLILDGIQTLIQISLIVQEIEILLE